MTYQCKTCGKRYNNDPYAIVGETTYCCYECLALTQGLIVGKTNSFEHLKCKEHETTN